MALLEVEDARAWRAVALNGSTTDAVAVAIADPSADALAALEATLGRPVEPRLTDEATLDDLLRRVYADADADEVTRALREEVPELSAYRTMLSKAQTLLACVLGFILAVGLLADLALTATVLVGIATTFFVISTGFRLYAAWEGCRPGATLNPSDAQLAALDERELPLYTILLPLYKEKPSTIRALFDALSELDYPKHKLDGLLLIEDDDEQTRIAIEDVGRPAWVRPLPLPAGVPRTKPRAMGIGLRYARGTLVTVYDAEDKPDRLAAEEGGLGLPAGRRLGGVPAGEARLLQPAPEPAHPLVHARVRRLVQHLPAGAAPHRRADPARRHLEPLPARRRSRRASAGTRTTSPRTPTSACASPGSG